MTPHMGSILGGFLHRVVHRMTGRQPQRGRDGVRVYLPLEDAMAETGLQEVNTYVSCHQNTVAKFIDTRPIVDLCLVAQWRPGLKLVKRWW